MASPRQIVEQLYGLAKDPENQAYIIRESGCMNGLVGYLSSADDVVVNTAVQAIHCLCQEEANRATIKEIPNLITKLCTLNSSSNAGIRSIVQKTLAFLQDAEAVGYGASHGPAAAHSETAPSERTPAVKKVTRPRPITIKIEGIAEDFWRRLVEAQLIRVPGVISVTLDTKREEAIVYTRKREGMLQALLDSLESLGVEGEAVGEAGSRKAKAPTIAPPRYLDDDDEVDNYFAEGVMTTNAGCSSLEARLAAKRKEQADKKAAASKTTRVVGWVGSIATGLGWW